MNCILQGNNVKVFGKALHGLSRIGEELWLDPTSKGLALRSVNAVHSAYACFLFTPPFFHHYSLGSGAEKPGQTLKCKLLIKSVLPLFRLTFIERNVKKCWISVSNPSDTLVIQFFCRHGITKTHNLHFQESEALQALFVSYLSPNILKAPARLLGDMVLHFPVSQEEITLSITPLRVSLRNHLDGEADFMKVMYTEMSLHPSEFDCFKVGMNSDITFCLKELRGFLSFAESYCLPGSIYFSAVGKPVCFSVEEKILQANVVLATLSDNENKGPAPPTGTPAIDASRGAHAVVVLPGSREADGTRTQEFPAMTELVASSQGDSPIISPPALMRLIHPIFDPNGLGAPDTSWDSANTTSASTRIGSLLFQALSSDLDDTDDRLPVLASDSDMEEYKEENYTIRS